MRGLTLERKDNNKGYSPGNCIWTSRKEQARNRSTNRIVKINGKALTVAEWSELSGVGYSTILQRIYKGDKGVSVIRPVKHLVKP